jgi:hypothetical protein
MNLRPGYRLGCKPAARAAMRPPDRDRRTINLIDWKTGLRPFFGLRPRCRQQKPGGVAAAQHEPAQVRQAAPTEQP